LAKCVAYAALPVGDFESTRNQFFPISMLRRCGFTPDFRECRKPRPTICMLRRIAVVSRANRKLCSVGDNRPNHFVDIRLRAIVGSLPENAAGSGDVPSNLSYWKAGTVPA
jgi:hypothetical protein